MIIRQAEASDSIAIKIFLLDTIPEAYSYIANGSLFRREWMDTPDYEEYAREVYVNDAGHVCLLLESGDEIVGTSAAKLLDKGAYELHSLYIAKPYRSQGFGTKLLSAVEESIPNWDVLYIDVITENHAAHDFHLKHDYKPIPGYVFPFRWPQWPEGSQVMMQRYEKRK